METEAAPLKHRKLWRKLGHVSIEGACEDPERLRNWFEFENSRASVSPHVAQGGIVPPTIGMEEDMNRTAEPVAFKKFKLIRFTLMLIRKSLR